MATSAAASEVQKNFGLYHDKAQKEPVQITKYGRETAYLVSAETFNEMWASFRRVVLARDLSDGEMAMIMRATVSPEHDYDYDESIERDEAPSASLKP